MKVEGGSEILHVVYTADGSVWETPGHDDLEAIAPPVAVPLQPPVFRERVPLQPSVFRERVTREPTVFESDEMTSFYSDETTSF